jgi:hypothetical protein
MQRPTIGLGSDSSLLSRAAYRWLAFAILTVYVLPLVAYGLWRIVRCDGLRGAL